MLSEMLVVWTLHIREFTAERKLVSTVCLFVWEVPASSASGFNMNFSSTDNRTCLETVDNVTIVFIILYSCDIFFQAIFFGLK